MRDHPARLPNIIERPYRPSRLSAGLRPIVSAATAAAARVVAKARTYLGALLDGVLKIGPCCGSAWFAYQAFSLLPASDRGGLLQPFVYGHLIPTGAVWEVLAGWDILTTATLDPTARPALLADVGAIIALITLSNILSYVRQRPSNVAAWTAAAGWLVALALTLADVAWLAREPWFWREALAGWPAGGVLRFAEAASLLTALSYQMPLAFNRVSPQHAQPVHRVMWRLFGWSIVAATSIPALWPFFEGLIVPAYLTVLRARTGTESAASWALLGLYLLIAWGTVSALALTPLKLLWSVIATLLLTRPLIHRDPDLFMPPHRGRS